MPRPREVRRSESFNQQARELYPPGGSSSGQASYEQFEDLVLKGVILMFSRQFDDLPIAVSGVESIRHVMTHAVPLFPALVVYGVLLADGAVELVALDVDEDYWDLIADDPDD